MHFSKAVIASFILNHVTNALPFVEETGPLSDYEPSVNITDEEQWGDLQRRVTKPFKDFKPSSGKKYVILDGRHGTDPYLSGTDLKVYETETVPNIMEKWKLGYKQVHGPYVAVPGKIKLVDILSDPDAGLKMEADHVFEAQIISAFMEHLKTDAKKKRTQAELEGYFLANHKNKYPKAAGKKNRLTKPDYKKDDYFGSLLQHMMAELGSARNLDRMALLTKSTNIRKGAIWGKNGVGKGKISAEIAYDYHRINDYMIKEQKGFCATVTGISNVLDKFREAREDDDPIDDLCNLFDETNIKRSEPEPASSPAEPPTSPVEASSSEPDIEIDDPNDGDYEEEPARQTIPIKDQDRPQLSGEYAKKGKDRDFKFDDEFIKFMKKYIKEVAEKMEASYKDVKDAEIPTGGDPLPDFKATFKDKLLDCTSLKQSIIQRRVESKKNSASSSRTCSRSSTRTSGTVSGTTSSGTATTTGGSSKTTLDTSTKPTATGDKSTSAANTSDSKPSQTAKPSSATVKSEEVKPTPTPKPEEPKTTAKPEEPKATSKASTPPKCPKGKKC